MTKSKTGFVWVLYNSDLEDKDNDGVLQIHRTEEGAKKAGEYEIQTHNEDYPDDTPLPTEWQEDKESEGFFIQTGDYQRLEVHKWILFP